jgi:hypothetical protein
MTESFLPERYEVPKTGGAYMKFRQGANKFRILSAPIIGYECWTEDRKPVRSRELWRTIPVDADVSGENGWNPNGFSGHRPTDKRHIKHQEESNRELFDKNRSCSIRTVKVREAAKASRESKLSRSERRERDEARNAAQQKVEETMEAVREFNEARGRLQILVWQMPSLYRRNAFRQTALKQKRGEFYDVLLFTSVSS